MKNTEFNSIAKTGTMLDVSLLDHLKASGAKTASKINGPNGAFISWTNADGVRNTLPIGRNSQDGVLADYKLIQTEDNVLIATINNYAVEEQVELN